MSFLAGRSLGRPVCCFLLTTCLSIAVGQDLNLRRLFTGGETASYATQIDVSRSVEGKDLAPKFGKFSVKATVRLKTVGIREGVATQFLSVLDAETNTPGNDWMPFLSGVVEVRAHNARPVTGRYLQKGKPAPMSWLSACLSVGEWVPPMPDRVLRAGESYRAVQPFPIGSLLGKGWPETVDVAVSYFPSVEGGFVRLGRAGADLPPVRSTNGKGKATGTLTPTGSFVLDMANGRLVSSSVGWTLRLDVTAPKELGGDRTIDYVLNIGATLKP